MLALNDTRGRIVAVILGLAVLAGFSGGACAYTEKTLHTFCQSHRCTDGSHPHDLVMDASGNFYGVTDGGGRHSGGTVFEFTPSTDAYQTLYEFCAKKNCADGRFPYRVKLVIDTAGNLYGTAAEYGPNGDGGVVFELVRGETGWQYKILYAFCPEPLCTDGGIPATGVTYAGAASGALYDGVSPLYGTAEFNGDYDRGVVFSLKPDKTGAWTQTVLHQFCPDMDRCPDGLDPRVPLYVDGSGNIFGATEVGGKHGVGVVYELSPRGKHFKFRVVHNFCAEDSCADGGEPFSNLVMDASGNLLGSTWSGGMFGHGILYKLAPLGGMHWQYSVLTTFDNNPGQLPDSLLLDASGVLFGTTLDGGAGFAGTVFKYDGALTTLYSFCAEKRCTDGESPLGNLIEDSAGNLFGTTEYKGHRRSGTIFELSL